MQSENINSAILYFTFSEICDQFIYHTMAKWGEGDPRWIVEERPDATNVNNWHWTEKNAGPWSQDQIKELFKNVPVNTDEAIIHITEVEKLEGEASANNRKGKLIFFYEWDIVLKWSGKLNEGSDREFKGKIKIPNLSEENDVSELDVSSIFSSFNNLLFQIFRLQNKCLL